MSKMSKNQANHGEGWKPRDNVDKRGINWSIAMLVQKGNWVAKKNPWKIKTNKKTKKCCKCELALPIKVHQHATDQGCKEKCSIFESKLQEVTSDRLTLGTHNCNQAIHCLQVWCHAVKWVNNGRGSSNWVNLNSGTHNHQMGNWNDHNWLRCDVSKLVGLSKLSLVVVESKWNSGELSPNSNDSKKKRKGKNCHFEAKCPRFFFQDTLPGLLKHSLLSEDACTFFQ